MDSRAWFQSLIHQKRIVLDSSAILIVFAMRVLGIGWLESSIDFRYGVKIMIDGLNSIEMGFEIRLLI